MVPDTVSWTSMSHPLFASDNASLTLEGLDTGQVPHGRSNSTPPAIPSNWSNLKKWRVTLLACSLTFFVQLNGTMMTSAAEHINMSFGISDANFPKSYWPVLSWNLAGAAAPLLGLPVMERFGVRESYLGIYSMLIVFIVPQAAAQNFATLITTRIFTGACSGILANATSGVVSDVWEPGRAKSFGTSLYIFGLLAGLNMGPVFGSIILHFTTWRWIFISQIIFYSSLLPVIFFLLPEVRLDVISKQQTHSTKDSSDQNVTATPHKRRKALQVVLEETIFRPTRMLCSEAVVFFFGLWSAFCIGIAFMFTQSIVEVYSQLYDWTFYETGLVQSAIVVGELIGLGLSLYQDQLYLQSARHNTENPGNPVPEARLYLSIPASFVGLAGGLFLFGWTAWSDIPWIVPTIALGLTGLGMFCSIAAVTTYVVDAYAKYASSAVAGCAFLENILAAFLPLATQSMYRVLGFHWASSLLGFFALALSLLPVILMRYGRKIRESSPFMSEAVHDQS